MGTTLHPAALRDGSDVEIRLSLVDGGIPVRGAHAALLFRGGQRRPDLAGHSRFGPGGGGVRWQLLPCFRAEDQPGPPSPVRAARDTTRSLESRPWPAGA